jgi:arylsulfatase A-like enzyme
VRNTTQVTEHRDKGYHLTEDIATDAIKWLREQRAYAPDRPFFMYWAPGASHGPHQVPKEWADKYQGKFDDGWDKYRERTFARQKQLGWIPPNTQLTPRPASMASWDSIPEDEKPFQRRLMEVFAGFTEHADYHAGRVIDEIEREGKLDNTLIFYIWGDNGSSAEGLNGTISEQLAQNGIPTKIAQHLKALDELGGLDALGGPKTDNMYHAAWAWAGSTPFRSTKLVAAHFGGTRNPLVISWPKGIKADKMHRSQFHHVNDIVPTLYAVLGIKHPEEVNGYQQDPLDGVSMAYTFADVQAAGRKKTQYFENNGRRGIYHDGWFACTFGPFIRWDTPGSTARLKDWDANKDVWELYDVTKDFTQADDLAAKEPQRLAKMKELFVAEAKANQALPIGGGLWTRFHPEDAITSPYKSWRFDATTTRMPEFSAPGLGKKSNRVTVDVAVGPEASGVLYALGGASGGLTLYMDKGQLVYEYNMLIIERTSVRSEGQIALGRHTVEIDTTIAKPGAAADVVLMVDGKAVAHTTVKRTVPAAFTASETLDVGVDLGSPVSLDYFDRAPFKFDGTIEKVTVELK